jgi:hypothetical protein
MSFFAFLLTLGTGIAHAENQNPDFLHNCVILTSLTIRGNVLFDIFDSAVMG